jgi:hypothetical protein
VIERLLQDLQAEESRGRVSRLWDRHGNTRTLGRLLTVAAIVFAAGISGSWFNAQFEGNLQGLAWGWFGALTAGGAVFLGVLYYNQGKRWEGGSIVVVGALADMLMSFQYFSHAKHDIITAAILGIFPSLLAILCGAAEATAVKVEKEQKKEDLSLAFGLQQDALDREAERQRKLIAETNRLKLDIARTEARTQSRLKELEVAANGHNGHTTGNGSGHWTDTPGQMSGGGQMSGHVSGQPTTAQIYLWMDQLRQEGQMPTGSLVAAHFGVTDRTGRRWITTWKEERGIKDGEEGLA